MATLPDVGAMGVCVIKEPFTLADGEIARIIGVDTFEALGYRGIDVKQKHYLDLGLTEADYVSDYNDNPYIITIVVTGTSAPMFVPVSYFTSFPSLGENVPYNDVAMIVKLGLLPSELSINTAIENTITAVNAAIGVEAEVELLNLPISGGVNYDESITLESVRTAKINRTVPLESQLSELRQQVQSQIEYIAILEQTITQNENA